MKNKVPDEKWYQQVTRLMFWVAIAPYRRLVISEIIRLAEKEKLYNSEIPKACKELGLHGRPKKSFDKLVILARRFPGHFQEVMKAYR